MFSGQRGSTASYVLLPRHDDPGRLCRVSLLVLLGVVPGLPGHVVGPGPRPVGLVGEGLVDDAHHGLALHGDAHHRGHKVAEVLGVFL